ncbi:hydrolase [Pedobacter sp. BS3]|uniref:SGNH/GDSL hydrolase family protein n=1 Tax=Pedobacter sp. BS3 TaxID=2567937 RepID=UPI0011ED2588|nr:SGNH/GDSL hydrolase family protein [Pedobacter sp. BS3]TZF82528.1 hydrolase [Pedobacter sp. BS3]
MDHLKLKFIIAAWALCLTVVVKAQDKNQLVYTDVASLPLTGKVLPTKNPYHRVDTATYPALPKAVKYLLTQSAGIAVHFTTNSTKIGAKWCVKDNKPGVNQVPINQKGLDLYIKRDGQWVFAGVGKPSKECNEGVLVQNMESGTKECLMYLPTYDETTSLQIGVEKNASFRVLPDPFSKRILIYGSSITQGAAASRPGMAYPARLSRETGLNFLNLGLSGNGKMEKAAADMIIDIDADAYILDCVANPSPEQIKERTAYLVNTIRKAHPKAPIIVIQSVVREGGNFDQVIRKRVADQNTEIVRQVTALQNAGVKDLYMIKGKSLLGTDHEATVDGTHPTDLGFDRMLTELKPQIIDILKKYGIAGK